MRLSSVGGSLSGIRQKTVKPLPQATEPPKFSGNLSKTMGMAALGLASLLPLNIVTTAPAEQPVATQPTPALPPVKPIELKTIRAFLDYLSMWQNDLNKNPNPTPGQIAAFSKRLEAFPSKEAAHWVHRTVPEQPSVFLGGRPYTEQLEDSRLHPFVEILDKLLVHARQSQNKALEEQVKNYFLDILLKPDIRRLNQSDTTAVQYTVLSRLNREFGTMDKTGHKEYPFTLQQGLQLTQIDSSDMLHMFKQLPRLRQTLSQWFTSEIQRHGLRKVLDDAPESHVTVFPGKPAIPLWQALKTAQGIFSSTIKPDDMYQEFAPQTGATPRTILPELKTAYANFLQAAQTGNLKNAETDYLLLSLPHNNLYGTNRIIYQTFTSDLEGDLQALRQSQDPEPLLDLIVKTRPAPDKVKTIFSMMMRNRETVPVEWQKRYLEALTQTSEACLQAIQDKSEEQATETLKHFEALYIQRDLLLKDTTWANPPQELAPLIEKWHQQTQTIVTRLTQDEKLTEEQAQKLLNLMGEREHQSPLPGKYLVSLLKSPYLDRVDLSQVVYRLQGATSDTHKIEYLGLLNDITQQYLDAIDQKQPEKAQKHLELFSNLIGLRQKLQLESLFSAPDPAARLFTQKWDEHSRTMTQLYTDKQVPSEELPGLTNMLRLRDEVSPVPNEALLNMFLESDITDEDALNFLNNKFYTLNQRKVVTLNQPEWQVKFLNKLNRTMTEGIDAASAGKGAVAAEKFRTFSRLNQFNHHFELSKLKPTVSPESAKALAQWESNQTSLLKVLGDHWEDSNTAIAIIQTLVDQQFMVSINSEKIALEIIRLMDDNHRSSTTLQRMDELLPPLQTLARSSSYAPDSPKNPVRKALGQYFLNRLTQYMKTPPQNNKDTECYNSLLRSSCQLAGGPFQDLSPLIAWQDYQLEKLTEAPSLKALEALAEEYEGMYLATPFSYGASLGQTEKFMAAGRPGIDKLIVKATRLMNSENPDERKLALTILKTLPELTPKGYVDVFAADATRDRNALLRPTLFARGRDVMGLLDRLTRSPEWQKPVSPDDLKGRSEILKAYVYSMSTAKADKHGLYQEKELADYPPLKTWDSQSLNQYLGTIKPLLESALKDKSSPQWRQAAIESIDALVNLFPNILKTDQDKAMLLPLEAREAIFAPMVNQYLDVLAQNPADFNGSEAESLCRVMRWVADPASQSRFREVWAKAVPGNVAVTSKNIHDASRQVAALRFLPPTAENVALIYPYRGVDRPMVFNREGLGLVVNAWFWQDWLTLSPNAHDAFLYEFQEAFLPPIRGNPIPEPAVKSEITPAQRLLMDLMHQTHLGKPFNEVMGRSMGSESSLAHSLAWKEYPPEAYSSALNLEYIEPHVLASLPPDLTIEKIKAAQYRFTVEFCKQFSNSKPDEMAEMRRLMDEVRPTLRRFARHRIETLDKAILDTLPPEIKKDLKWALDGLERNPKHERALEVIQGVGTHMYMLNIEWSTQFKAQGQQALLPTLDTINRLSVLDGSHSTSRAFFAMADTLLSTTQLPQDSVIDWQAYQPDELPENWNRKQLISDDWMDYGKHRELQAAYAKTGQLASRSENPMRPDLLVVPGYVEYRSMDDLVNAMAFKIQLAENAYSDPQKLNAHYDATMADLKKYCTDLFNENPKSRLYFWVSFTNTFLESPALGNKTRKERLELLETLGVDARDIDYYTSDIGKSILKEPRKK